MPAAARREGRPAKGDIDLIHANTEATLAVAASHRGGGGWCGGCCGGWCGGWVGGAANGK